MEKILKAIAAVFSLVILSLPSPVYGAAEVGGPAVRFEEKKIFVGTELRLDPGYIGDMKKGVSKEIVFQVDLFRVWDGWPDEFVLGKTITRTLNCDPVKKEYTATSLEGNRLLEKRFRDCDGLLAWALALKNVMLTNTAELEPAEYFVKVTAESRLINLPPFIDLLLFFVHETAFRVVKKSATFGIRP